MKTLGTQINKRPTCTLKYQLDVMSEIFTILENEKQGKQSKQLEQKNSCDCPIVLDAKGCTSKITRDFVAENCTP